MTIPFTEQLRIIDDSGLDPFQRTLLFHYWRRGQCWETVRTTAEHCKMSPAKVSTARQELIDAGWIEWRPVEIRPGKAKMAIVVCSRDEQTQQNSCSPDEQCSPHEQNPVELVHDMNAILNEPSSLNEPNTPPTPPDDENPEAAEEREWGEILDLMDIFVDATSINPPHRGYKRGRESLRFEWLLPLQELKAFANGSSGDLVRQTVDEMKRKRLTIASPRSILNIARSLREYAGSGERVDKRELLDHLSHLVKTHGRRRYKQAQEEMRPELAPIVRAMGPWEDICRLNEKQLPIRFYEAYNNAERTH